MAEILYYPDNEYQKKFDSIVSKVKEDKGYICLEETLFYKEGGGQPSDQGKLEWENGEAKVVDVQKSHGEIRHFIEGDFPESGVEVHGDIDWLRRYKHMRMHTAQHIISWVVLNKYDAATVGNQIHQEYSRIDFEPADFNEKDIEEIEKAVNSMIDEAEEVEKKEMSRDLVEEKVTEGRTNLDLIPDGIDPLRVVMIGEDVCPCGGTHVNNLEELEGIEIIERISKGKDVERLKFKLK